MSDTETPSRVQALPAVLRSRRAVIGQGAKPTFGPLYTRSVTNGRGLLLSLSTGALACLFSSACSEDDEDDDADPDRDEAHDEMPQAAVALSNFGLCDAFPILQYGADNGTIN